MATVKLKFHLMVNVYTFQIVYHTHLGSIPGAHSICAHTNTQTRSSESRENQITLCGAEQQQQQQIHWQLPRFIDGLLYANSIFNTSITTAQQCWCRELWHMKFSAAFFFLVEFVDGLQHAECACPGHRQYGYVNCHCRRNMVFVK